MKSVQTLLGVGASIATVITFSAISIEPMVVAPTPSIHSLNPNSSQTNGGITSITYGTHFDVPAAVTNGGLKSMANTITSNMMQVMSFPKNISPVNVTVNQVDGKSINDVNNSGNIQKIKSNCDKGGGNGSESCDPGNSPNKGHDDENGKRK